MKTSGIRFRFFFKHSSLPSKRMFPLIGENVLTSGESLVRSGDIKAISWHNFLFVWDSGSASQRWDDKTTFCTSLTFGEGLSSSGNILLILGDSSRLFGKNSTFFWSRSRQWSWAIVSLASPAEQFVHGWKYLGDVVLLRWIFGLLCICCEILWFEDGKYVSLARFHLTGHWEFSYSTLSSVAALFLRMLSIGVKNNAHARSLYTFKYLLLFFVFRSINCIKGTLRWLGN